MAEFGHMTLYTYRASDPDGRTVTGLVCGRSAVQARARLKERNLTVESLEQSEIDAPSARALSRDYWYALSHLSKRLARQAGDKRDLRDELAQMRDIAGDEALVNNLDTLLTENKDRIGLAELSPLYPRELVPMYMRLIAADSRDAAVPDNLNRLAGYCYHRAVNGNAHSRKRSIIMAGFVVGLCFAVAMFIAVITSAFGLVFESFGRVPLPTFLVLSVGYSLRAMGPAGILVSLAAAAGLLGLASATRLGGALIDAIRWRLPVVSRYRRSLARSELLQHLALSTASTNDESEAVHEAANACNDRFVRGILFTTMRAAADGIPALDSLRSRGLLSSVQTWEIGELLQRENGAFAYWEVAMGERLRLESARGARNDVLALAVFTILLLGVGFVVVSLFMPILLLTGIV